MEAMINAARRLLRPKLEKAMRDSFAPCVRFADCFLHASCSVYRTASSGDTFAAFFAGLRVLIYTVTIVNNEAMTKISGEVETCAADAADLCSALKRFIATGSARHPAAKPPARPMGSPIRVSQNACRFTSFLICRGEAPIVRSSPYCRTSCMTEISNIL